MDEKMDEPLDYMPCLAKCRVRDLPEGIVSGDLDSVLSRVVAQITDTSVVVNSFEGHEAAVLPHLPALHPRFFLVPSTLLKTPPDNQPDALRAPTPPAVYVAFGSVVLLLPAELTALAEALEATPFRFVWSLDKASSRACPTGSRRGRGEGKGGGAGPPGDPRLPDALRADLGAGGRSGWGAARVPAVLRGPKAQREVGVEVEGGRLTKEDVVRALEAVMVGEEGRKMKDRAELLMMSAMEAVGEGGTSERNLFELVDVVLAGKTTIVE